MHSTTIWLHNVSKNQPPVNIETNASPLIDSENTVHAECRLCIERAPGYGSITLMMTNAQAQQIIDTLTAHLESNADS
jgi:hypothetical protein